MVSQSLKQIADQIMKSSCRVIGVVFETHARYIESREGKSGIDRVENKMKELGYPIKFEEIKAFKYYPVGLADLVILVAKEEFGWTKKDIFDMGSSAPKYSFITKVLMKYFLSLKTLLRQAPKIWERHFTEGEIEAEVYPQQKYGVVYLKYKVTHPLICSFYAGYILRLFQYVVETKQAYIKETECRFKGDPHHKFVVRWN